MCPIININAVNRTAAAAATATAFHVPNEKELNRTELSWTELK